MPKMKTHSSSKKRFRKKKSGLIKFSHGYRRHLLTKKSPKCKRNLRQGGYLCDADKKLIAPLLPY